MSKEANIWNRVNSAWREIVDSATIGLELTPGKATFKVKGGTALTSAAAIWVIDSGILAMTTGIKGDIYVPFDCEIVEATLLADQMGDIVIDVWSDAYGNYPPTDADSITASAPMTISNSDKSQDATLTGWDTTIVAGTTLRFNVDSVTDIQRVVITLTLEKSLG